VKLNYTMKDGRKDSVSMPAGEVEITTAWLDQKRVNVAQIDSIELPAGVSVTGLSPEITITRVGCGQKEQRPEIELVKSAAAVCGGGASKDEPLESKVHALEIEQPVEAPSQQLATVDERPTDQHTHGWQRALASIALGLTGVGAIAGLIQFLATRRKGLPGTFLFNKPTNRRKAKYEREYQFKYTDDTGESSIELPVGMTTITEGWLDTKLNRETVTSVVIPGSVTSIERAAFQGCSALQSVLIPEGVTTIGESAFQGCSALESVLIPEGVTTIGESAFGECVALQSVVIPGSVTSIGWYAFSNCRALQSVVIPDSVRTIGVCAFWGCSVLQSVVIPEGVTSIDRSAFEDCSALQSVVIPDSVTRIEKYAFRDCSALESVVIPDSVTSIGEWAFRGCSALQSVVIPDSVTRIGEGAFEGCTALESVVIPDSVTGIGQRVFYGCTALQSVVIPDSVTSIGEYAFMGCSALQTVVIPDSVTSIGEWVFCGCTALQSVVIPDSVTSIGGWAFRGCRNLRYMLVPVGLDLARARISDAAQVICYDPTIKGLPLSARIVVARGMYNKIVNKCELSSAEDKLQLQRQLKGLFFSKEQVLKPALRQLALLSRVGVLSEGKLVTGQLLQVVYQHMTENYKVICKGEEGRTDSGQARQSLMRLLDGLSKKTGIERGPLTNVMSFVGPELNFLMRGESPDFQEKKAGIGGGAGKP
jgi:hypothetical protein